MKKHIATISAFALTLATGPAAADGLLGLSGGADVKIGVNAESSLGKQFKALDADGDGVITRNEAEANAELTSNFGAMDDDNDDALTRAEFKSGLKARAEGAGNAAANAADKAKASARAGADASADAAAKSKAKMEAGVEATGEAASEEAASTASDPSWDRPIQWRVHPGAKALPMPRRAVASP